MKRSTQKRKRQCSRRKQWTRFYVSECGSDTNAGTSAELSLRTLTEAMKRSGPEDEIWLFRPPERPAVECQVSGGLYQNIVIDGGVHEPKN